MASHINEIIQIKVDGKLVAFNSIELAYLKNELDIKLVLLDGSVIRDNGERVEIIVNS